MNYKNFPKMIGNTKKEDTAVLLYTMAFLDHDIACEDYDHIRKAATHVLGAKRMEEIHNRILMLRYYSDMGDTDERVKNDDY